MSIQAAIDLAVEDHKSYCRSKGMVGYDYEHVDSLRAAQSELSQLRQLCREQHEALKRANNALCSAMPINRKPADIKEYTLSARDCRAAIEKYNSVMK